MNPLEESLKTLRPQAPDEDLEARIRMERALASWTPLAPSDLLGERIARDRSAWLAGTRPDISPDTHNTARRRHITAGALITAAAVLIAGLFMWPKAPAPNPDGATVAAVASHAAVAPHTAVASHTAVAPRPGLVESGDTPAGAHLPHPFTPVSAHRTYVDSEDGGIKRIDGRPVRVVHLNARDKIEYEHEGRRIIIERPARHTVYNQLAYH